MRYFFLLLLVPSFLSLLTRQTVAAAETEAENDSTGSIQSQDFWPTAQQLIQEQIFLIARIEKAIAGPDPNQVRAVQGQLTLHRGAVDRFLKGRYPIPKFLCGPVANPTDNLLANSSDLTLPQKQAYCALYASTQQLEPLAAVLDRRLYMLSTLAEVKPLPLVTGEWSSNAGVPTLGRPNLGAPAKPLAPAVNLPPTEPLLGRPTKQPIADYVPPVQPAIVPPEDAAPALQAAKRLLAQAQAVFPDLTQFRDPGQDEQRTDRLKYELYPPEVQLYKQFLAQPNTGIARILPASFYHSQPQQLQNRLVPTVAERFPFAPLPQRSEGLNPRLTLQIAEGQFQIVPSGLDYGFMVDLGDVPLEDLSALPPEKVKLPVQTRQFFFSYRPPNDLAALQVDRRRFLTGKVGNFVLKEPLFSAAPAVVGHTYLLRSLQFNLPKLITEGQPITRDRRRYLDQLLAMQSSDVLVAFQPVSRRSDGSYTVLWRVLAQFPDPQIQDLDQYVKF